MAVVSVEARLEHVTVYASGARVRRVTTIPAPLPARVRIVGLPLAVIDDTVRVEVGGPALATGVRVGVDAPVAADAAPEEPADLAAAYRRRARAEVEHERLTAALALVAAAPVVAEVPGDEPPAAFSAVVAARRALAASRAERELVLRAQLAAADREVEDAEREVDALVDRERRAGSARAPRLHELRKHVELELQATAASEVVIHLEYQVSAARWAPSYVARIEGERVRLELRAVVAQDAGEDWRGVPLRLSTAEPERFALLPELAPQKIGRRQGEVARRGFRAPPTGAAELYADYARATAGRRRDEPPPPPPKTVTLAAPGDAFAEQVWDEESSRAKEAFSTPPAGAMATAMAAPQAARGAVGGGGAAVSFGADQLRRSKRGTSRHDDSTPPHTVPRLDYGSLVMAPASSPARGTLVPADPERHASAIASDVVAATTRIAQLALPAGHAVDWSHAYDYAFATDGAVDIAADGTWHSIAVTAKSGAVKLRHVAVPREQPDVFRVAELTNPLAGPLLPGPIDVYDRGRFLVTAAVEFTPPGAPVEVGLGVDPQLKIARNAEFREEATGMLRGGLELHHAVTIDVENLSPRAVELEVRERVPVVREGDDDVEVVTGKADPAWERWRPDPGAPRDLRLRGGYRWKLTLPAGAKETLRAAYTIKIAGKLELIGGNRREP